MSREQMQLMAYELTLEYIRVHTDVLTCNIEGIPDAVDKISEINIAFYDAICKNRKFDKTHL